MNLTIASTIISLLITILLPISLIILLIKKEAGSLKWAIVGGSVFFLFQIVTRIPLLNYLNLQPWYISRISTNTLILAIFLSVTAGLFEEGGRFLAFKFVLKERITWKKGIAFGLGHGGVEAIYLVGLPFLQLLIQQLSTGESLLMSVPYTSILLGGAERLLAMIIHIGLTLIILYGVKNREIIYLFLAILFHALVNMPIVFIKNLFLIYGYLIVWALIFIFIILKFRKELESRWFYSN